MHCKGERESPKITGQAEPLLCRFNFWIYASNTWTARREVACSNVKNCLISFNIYLCSAKMAHVTWLWVCLFSRGMECSHGGFGCKNKNKTPFQVPEACRLFKCLGGWCIVFGVICASQTADIIQISSIMVELVGYLHFIGKSTASLTIVGCKDTPIWILCTR